MYFIGQEHIRREIEYVMTEVLDGKNYNLLFRAPSGYGKTTLGLLVLSILGLENSCYYVPDVNGEIGEFKNKKRFHFIDEIHTLKSQEILYPLMDTNKYTIILASNESGELKEPLINRCIPFIFTKYTEEDISIIVEHNLRNFSLPKELINEIASRCRFNPRVTTILCKRLAYTFSYHGVPKDLSKLDEILSGILLVKKGGLTNLDEQYLEYLNRVGGIASLNTIISGIKLDRNLILFEIEPLLLYLGYIRITSRGRELCNRYQS